MSALEIAGTILGVIGVALMIWRSLWAFPISLAQVVLFGWVCFQAQLYSDAALQLMFFVALIHGWWRWTHPAAGETELPIQTLTFRARFGWIAGILMLWLVWGTAMRRLTDAALPYADGFVFATSVASQWLQARKNLENWAGWLVANTVAIGVFMAKELYLFAGLYVIFWFMALWGWREWHAARQAAKS